MYKDRKNLKYFIESRSNSSNNDEKQIFEAKTVIEIKLKLTANGCWPVFKETELPIERKTI